MLSTLRLNTAVEIFVERGIENRVRLFRGAESVHGDAQHHARIDTLVHIVAARTVVEVRFSPTFPIAFAPITNLDGGICARWRMLRAHMCRARRMCRLDQTYYVARAPSGAIAVAALSVVSITTMRVRGDV